MRIWKISCTYSILVHMVNTFVNRMYPYGVPHTQTLSWLHYCTQVLCWEAIL